MHGLHGVGHEMLRHAANFPQCIQLAAQGHVVRNLVQATSLAFQLGRNGLGETQRRVMNHFRIAPNHLHH